MIVLAVDKKVNDGKNLRNQEIPKLDTEQNSQGNSFRLSSHQNTSRCGLSDTGVSPPPKLDNPPQNVRPLVVLPTVLLTIPSAAHHWRNENNSLSPAWF